MIEARLSQLANVLHPRLIKGDAAFAGVSTDSRSVKPGELFVALRGERFDAHEFLHLAKQAGAAAAIVEREIDIDLPQLVCLDTQVALGDIARWWRGFTDAKVIGITGSNGKTTVKQLTASILSRVGRTHFNAGNLNNEIGLPLSILRMASDTEFAVLEMGAGKPGDIEYLARIGQPRVALVNNVAPAHLERMGSLEGVAETKGAIYAALPADGVAVINADCMFAPKFVARTPARRRISFALEAAADVTAEIRSLGATSRFLLKTPRGSVDVELPMSGRHNVRNALAASALALAAGAPLEAIKTGLEQVEGVSGRLTRHALPNGAIVIDDSYNANPGSVRAAIDTLALERGDRWLVLGNMAELGPTAFALHEEIGRHARDAGIDHLVTVGALAAGASAAFDRDAHHCDSQRDAIGVLEKALGPDAIVLVKGSRSAGMERIVDALLGRNAKQGGHHAA